MEEKTKNVNNLLFFVKGLAFLFSITENFFNRSPTSCNIMKEARIFVSFIQPLDAASLAPESLLIGIGFVQCNLNFLVFLSDQIGPSATNHGVVSERLCLTKSEPLPNAANIRQDRVRVLSPSAFNQFRISGFSLSFLSYWKIPFYF